MLQELSSNDSLSTGYQTNGQPRRKRLLGSLTKYGTMVASILFQNLAQLVHSLSITHNFHEVYISLCNEKVLNGDNVTT